MTVNLCAVTGTLVAPDGSPMPDVQVQFLPAPATVRGQGTQSLHPRPVAIAADAGAEIRVDLAPGVYTVRTRDSNGRDYQPYLIDVPNDAAALLSDIMLLLPAPQTVYDAAASARVAANAAGSARESAQLAAASAEEAVLNGGTGDARTFASRAAFGAADIPDTLERWTVLHAGKALDYIRDAAGTAIESANGVKGSPAGAATPQHWGAVGDGVANDTAALAAWLARGGGDLPAAVYLADDLTVTAPVAVRAHPFAVIRKRAAATANSVMLRFAPGAEGSVWEGGVIDGNAEVLRPAYQALNPTLPLSFVNGWFGVQINCADVTFRGVSVSNQMAIPLQCPGDRAVVEDIVMDRCGSHAHFGWVRWNPTGGVPRPEGAGCVGQRVRNLVIKRGDNRNCVVNQKAIDFRDCLDGIYRDVFVSDMGGDLAGQSQWVSGITLDRCVNCTFENMEVRDFVSQELGHVGISLLGNINCLIENPLVDGCAGVALELNANYGVEVVNPRLDGSWLATEAHPFGSHNMVGLSWYKGSWDTYRTAKSLVGNRRCAIRGGYIRRFTTNARMRDNDHILDGVEIYAALQDGVQVTQQALSDYFAGAGEASITSNIRNCRIHTNGRAGVNGGGYTQLMLAGNEVFNNGQDATEDAAFRSGVRLASGERAELSGNAVYDNQSWSRPASFEPGAGTVHRVWMDRQAEIALGQWLRIANGTGSGPVLARVVGMDDTDGVTLEAAAPVTLSATGNTVALSGTWSGSGLILTGTGGAAMAQVPGPRWVTNGTQWRRVRRVDDNNTLHLDAPFTPALSGATLSKLETAVEGVPSQQFGLRAFGAAGALYIAPDNQFRGNVQHSTELSNVANVAPGSEYERISVTAPTTANQNLQTQIPAGHSLLGVSVRVDGAISGPSSWTLRLVNGAGATIADLATGIGVTKNTKLRGVAGYFNTASGNSILRAVFASGPGGGPITCHARYRVAAPDALADQP